LKKLLFLFLLIIELPFHPSLVQRIKNIRALIIIYILTQRAATRDVRLDIVPRMRRCSGKRFLNSDLMPITPIISSCDLMGRKQ
jgi:hypothetical protein